MKEKYTELEAEVIRFTPSDVIITSPTGGDTTTPPVTGSNSSTGVTSFF